MTAEFVATPRATSAPFEPVVVALGAATTKTVLQVATPSTTDIKVLGWSVSFDGAAAAQPGWCQLLDCDVAATGLTSITPELWGNALQQASLCVGGTSATGHTATGEGTLTVARSLDSQEVYPQSGYAIWFPDTHLPRIAPSRFLRIRCKFPGAVNVIPIIYWGEPAL
jgi:hypothetical protein